MTEWLSEVGREKVREGEKGRKGGVSKKMKE